jgi:Mg/Co/Ni transporter MgtE
MTEEHRLATAYFDTDPQSAAKLLETLDDGDVAAFVASLSDNLAAEALFHLSPGKAASCICHLPTGKAARILSVSRYNNLTGIFRLLDEGVRDQLLAELPAKLRRQITRSLNFPENTVGAWMDASIPSFRGEMKISEVLNSLKESSVEFGGYIFVTDEEDSFAGVLAIESLLKASPDGSLAELKPESVRPLGNRMPIDQAAASPLWEEHAILPVLGRNRKVLGGLSRATLSRAMASEDISAARPGQSGSLWLDLFGAYLVICGGLLRTIFITETRTGKLQR